MAKRRTKIPRKNKSIDDDTIIDIVETRDNALGFFERNQKTILGTALAIGLLIAALVCYKFFYSEPRDTAAKEQMYKAEEQFLRDSFALALENPGGGFEGFLDIIDNYNGTASANLAKYYAGVSYLNLGKYQEAIDYLSSYNPGGKVTPVMKNGALGDAHSELNDLDKAVGFYQKAAYGEENEFLSPYYLKKYAMLSSLQGDDGSAQKAYKLIKEKYPTSTEGSTIDRYIKE